MFKGGYTLDEALQVCQAWSSGAAHGDGVSPGAQRDSRAASRVSAALRAAGLTDTVAQRLLAVGERTGGFDAVLQTIADRHAQRVRDLRRARHAHRRAACCCWSSRWSSAASS